MTFHRLAGPPPDVEAELERLLDEWVNSDTQLEFDKYISYHASEKVKAHMKEMENIRDEVE